MHRYICLTLSLTIIFSHPTALLADFRCPSSGKVVQTGMSAYQVQSACGQPVDKRIVSGGIRVTTNTGENTEVVAGNSLEEWTYDFGSNYLIQILRFKNGQLQSHTTAGYGTSKEKK